MGRAQARTRARTRPRQAQAKMGIAGNMCDESLGDGDSRVHAVGITYDDACASVRDGKLTNSPYRVLFCTILIFYLAE